jgi:hypothetical protein
LEVRAHTAGMAVAEVICSRCGEVRVPAREIRVYPQTGEVRFICPVCRQGQVRTFGDDIIAVLMQHGAKVFEVLEPITIDDVIDFHERFEDEMRQLLKSKKGRKG